MHQEGKILTKLTMEVVELLAQITRTPTADGECCSRLSIEMSYMYSAHTYGLTVHVSKSAFLPYVSYVRDCEWSVECWDFTSNFEKIMRWLFEANVEFHFSKRFEMSNIWSVVVWTKNIVKLWTYYLWLRTTWKNAWKSKLTHKLHIKC